VGAAKLSARLQLNLSVGRTYVVSTTSGVDTGHNEPLRRSCRSLRAGTLGRGRADDDRRSQAFTPLQGQYLAFIRMYTLIHREPPAQADMQRFFRVTPPSVHQMVLTLERRGLLQRSPGKSRSLRVLVDPDMLPPLTDPAARR
jgi:repressor LexA